MKLVLKLEVEYTPDLNVKILPSEVAETVCVALDSMYNDDLGFKITSAIARRIDIVKDES